MKNNTTEITTVIAITITIVLIAITVATTLTGASQPSKSQVQSTNFCEPVVCINVKGAK